MDTKPSLPDIYGATNATGLYRILFCPNCVGIITGLNLIGVRILAKFRENLPKMSILQLATELTFWSTAPYFRRAQDNSSANSTREAEP